MVRIYDNDSLIPPEWLFGFFPSDRLEIVSWPSARHHDASIDGGIQWKAENDCWQSGKDAGYDAIALLDVDEYIVMQNASERVEAPQREWRKQERRGERVIC